MHDEVDTEVQSFSVRRQGIARLFQNVGDLTKLMGQKVGVGRGVAVHFMYFSKSSALKAQSRSTWLRTSSTLLLVVSQIQYPYVAITHGFYGFCCADGPVFSGAADLLAW